MKYLKKSKPYYFKRSRAAKVGKILKYTANRNKRNAGISKRSNMHKSQNKPHHMDRDSCDVPSVKNDENGHLVFQLGDVLENRYKIMDTLGKGTFGQVLHVKDLETDSSIALKIIRNVWKYREAAEDEISILKMLGTIDPTSVHLCVKMLSSFNYHGHVCIAFEKFGLSVYDFLQENDYDPYEIDQIRHVAYQLCYSVKFLHDNKVTHTDLKPENIIFVNSDYDLIHNSETENVTRRLWRTDIRLIDFGNAVFDDEEHYETVCTRNYRAPEVILKLGWAQPCDVWSISCILYEMYMGCILFHTRTSMEHLAIMERLLGEIPSGMAKATKTTYLCDGKIDLREVEDSGSYVNDHCLPLMMHKKQDDEDHDDLFELMQRMLEYDPSRRITLQEAMSHNFFTKIPAHQRLND